VRRAGAIAAAAVAWIVAGASGSAAIAGPQSPVKAVVSLGDSYISGEAGRWDGNSNQQLGSRNGTDRAWVRTWYGGFYDRARVYLEGTGADGSCHRSDVAEIRSSAIPDAEARNVACSGARTRNIFRAVAGGSGQNGELPQADRLAAIAAERDVELVVLSVGGNDLGFARIIADCATLWITSTRWNPSYCAEPQQAEVNARMPAALAGVRKALREIESAMASAGFARTDYRLVLQSYPSPIPRAAENRYSETGWSRLDTGGCPFWNHDSDWARDSLVNQVADALHGVARQQGTEFLDLRDALQGREACARGRALAGPGGPSAAASEWVRFLVSGIAQGDLQESFHPNAYGQRAIGRCLRALWERPRGAWACRPAGASTSDMELAPA
jgi:hypothetical protein